MVRPYILAVQALKVGGVIGDGPAVAGPDQVTPEGSEDGMWTASVPLKRRRLWGARAQCVRVQLALPPSPPSLAPLSSSTVPLFHPLHAPVHLPTETSVPDFGRDPTHQGEVKRVRHTINDAQQLVARTPDNPAGREIVSARCSCCHCPANLKRAGLPVPGNCRWVSPLVKLPFCGGETLSFVGLALDDERPIPLRNRGVLRWDVMRTLRTAVTHAPQQASTPRAVDGVAMVKRLADDACQR